MKLADFLEEKCVIADMQARTKEEVLAELVRPFTLKCPDIDPDKVLAVLLEREKLGTTGIGWGIAIPHGKLANIENISLVVGRCREGVDFTALDHKPCHIFFLVLAPEHLPGMHLRILAHISRLLQDASFCQAFLDASDNAALYALLQKN